MGVSGIELGAAAVGALFIYGGIKGKSPLLAFRAVVAGDSPASVSQTEGIGDGSASASTAAASDSSLSAPTPSGGSAQAALKNAAARFGWDTGAEWQSLNNIEMNEAGYNPTAKNSASGALGIAQALGHGNSNTAGSLGNEYGGYGLTNAQAKAANSGDANAQALWMVNYIKSRYGDPNAAWAQYHHPDGSKWY